MKLIKCHPPTALLSSLPDAVYTARGVEACLWDLIQRRAYELYEQRGRQPGHDVEDWLQAEREIALSYEHE